MWAVSKEVFVSEDVQKGLSNAEKRARLAGGLNARAADQESRVEPSAQAGASRSDAGSNAPGAFRSSEGLGASGASRANANSAATQAARPSRSAHSLSQVSREPVDRALLVRGVALCAVVIVVVAVLVLALSASA